MTKLSLAFLAFVSSTSAFIVVPQAPTRLYFTSPYTVPQLYINPGISLFPGAGPTFKPTRDAGNANLTVPVLPAEPLNLGRAAPRNVDLCYFLGNDISSSHVACNQNWADGTAEGVSKYINELTFEANRVLGENNLKLVWKGPYARHDAATQRYPSNPSQDTLSVAREGCDAVVFLVFNEFKQDCSTPVAGQKFGGITQGGMCESARGSGYSVVVDQGFLDDVWTGPQILAHHLIKMLIDAKDKTCPNKESLLYPQMIPGQQRVDPCVADKLNQSKISSRPCLQN